MKKIPVFIVVLILIAATVLKLSSNHKSMTKKVTDQSQTVAMSAVSVNVATAEKKILDQSVELTGVLTAYKEIDIASEAQGIVESVNFESGQHKTKGETLARIDSKLKQLSVENAKMSAMKLKNDLDRIENLFKGGTSSQQELDNARYSYENAVVALSQAEKQLSDATVISPISGIITEKYVEAGAYINAGSPVAAIVDISKFKVKLNVSETNVYRLKTGDKAIVTSDVYPGISFDGQISYISCQGDNSHNYPVEITISNSQQHPMKAGTFVTAHITISDSQKRLYIPRKALQGSTKDASVYIVDNSKAVLKNIVVGINNSEYIEVVSGISENDKVIVAGQLNCSDGKAVSIVN